MFFLSITASCFCLGLACDSLLSLPLLLRKISMQYFSANTKWLYFSLHQDHVVCTVQAEGSSLDFVGWTWQVVVQNFQRTISSFWHVELLGNLWKCFDGDNCVLEYRRERKVIDICQGFCQSPKSIEHREQLFTQRSENSVSFEPPPPPPPRSEAPQVWVWYLIMTGVRYVFGLSKNHELLFNIWQLYFVQIQSWDRLQKTTPEEKKSKET